MMVSNLLPVLARREAKAVNAFADSILIKRSTPLPAYTAQYTNEGSAKDRSRASFSRGEINIVTHIFRK